MKGGAGRGQPGPERVHTDSRDRRQKRRYEHVEAASSRQHQEGRAPGEQDEPALELEDRLRPVDRPDDREGDPAGQRRQSEKEEAVEASGVGSRSREDPGQEDAGKREGAPSPRHREVAALVPDQEHDRRPGEGSGHEDLHNRPRP